MKRLINLDYLRGLSAFGIMLFHCITWIYGRFSSIDFFARFGLYGVSIFYIISGIVLYEVYYNKIIFTVNSVSSFVRMRFFRLYPLIVIVILITLIFEKTNHSIVDIILNVSGLFGFIKWDGSFITGMWSIGNELVFYFFFILFALFTKITKHGFIITGVLLLSIYIYIAFYILDTNIKLENQWRNYVNPLNQIFLFYLGLFIAKFSKYIDISLFKSCLIILLGAIVFIFNDAKGDPINLVTGYNRLLFTFSCCLICYGFYHFNTNFPKYIHISLVFISKISYSLYLLHPIIFNVINHIILIFNQYVFKIKISKFNFFIIIVITSLLISNIVYNKIELYFIKYSKKLK